MKYFLISFFIIVAGCAPNDTPRTQASTDLYSVGLTNVRIVTLSDGTRCAVTSNGSIDCDWHTIVAPPIESP